MLVIFVPDEKGGGLEVTGGSEAGLAQGLEPLEVGPPPRFRWVDSISPLGFHMLWRILVRDTNCWTSFR